MSLIDGLPVGDISLSTVILLVVLMVLTGRLVPRRHLDDSIKREEAQAEINRTNSAQLGEIRATLGHLVEGWRTTDHMLRSIQGHSPAEYPGQQQEATTS